MLAEPQIGDIHSKIDCTETKTHPREEEEVEKTVENDDANDMALFGHLRARKSTESGERQTHPHRHTQTFFTPSRGIWVISIENLSTY